MLSLQQALQNPSDAVANFKNADQQRTRFYLRVVAPAEKWLRGRLTDGAKKITPEDRQTFIREMQRVCAPAGDRLRAWNYVYQSETDESISALAKSIDDLVTIGRRFGIEFQYWAEGHRISRELDTALRFKLGATHGVDDEVRSVKALLNNYQFQKAVDLFNSQYMRSILSDASGVLSEAGVRLEKEFRFDVRAAYDKLITTIVNSGTSRKYSHSSELVPLIALCEKAEEGERLFRFPNGAYLIKEVSGHKAFLKKEHARLLQEEHCKELEEHRREMEWQAQRRRDEEHDALIAEADAQAAMVRSVREHREMGFWKRMNCICSNCEYRRKQYDAGAEQRMRDSQRKFQADKYANNWIGTTG